MLNFRISLFTKEWLDVIFKNRNKSYGAYELRAHRGSTTLKALILSAVVYILLFLAPNIIKMFGNGESEEQIAKIVEVSIQPPPVSEHKVLPPPLTSSLPAAANLGAKAPLPRNNQIKFPPPIVKPDEQVRDVPPQIEDLKNSNPGQFTVQGDASADIVNIGPVGTGVKQAEVVGDSKIYNFNVLETLPEFPGGMAKFYQFLKNAVQYPEMARINNIQGKVFLSFVVEKDGRLTDIKADRKVGGGLDEEAIRVLKSSPHWIPGIQNGHAVRVQYNIPISFTLAQNF